MLPSLHTATVHHLRNFYLTPRYYVIVGMHLSVCLPVSLLCYSILFYYVLLQHLISAKAHSKARYWNQISKHYSINISRLIPWRNLVVYMLRCESLFEEIRFELFFWNGQELWMNRVAEWTPSSNAFQTVGALKTKLWPKCAITYTMCQC